MVLSGICHKPEYDPALCSCKKFARSPQSNVHIIDQQTHMGFFMFLGTALYVFFQVFPTNAAAEMLDGTQKAEDILPYFIMHNLPHGVAGMIIAAAIAAAMSSLDSSINAMATVGVHDIYRRHWVKDRDDKHYLHVAWCLATAITIAMIIGACLLYTSPSPRD